MNRIRRRTASMLALALGLLGVAGAALAEGVVQVVEEAVADTLNPGAIEGKTVYLADARGVPFCTFEVVEKKSASLVQIYDTTGVDICNVEKFGAIDAKALAKKHRVAEIVKVPVRRWVADRLWSYDAGETRDLGGVKATWVAAMEPALIPLGADGTPLTAYRDRQLHWRTKAEWSKGSQVQVLRSPDDKVWVMLAYAGTDDAKLSGLAKVGSALSLPKGWTSESRTLDEKLVYSPREDSGHLVHSVTDDLRDLYVGCGFDDACSYLP